MLNKINLLEQILNSDKTKKSIQYSVGFIETAYAIMAIEQYDITLDVPLPNTVNFMVKDKDVHTVIDRSKKSFIVTDIYANDPVETNDLGLLIGKQQFNIRPIKSGNATALPWTFLPYREYPNLQFTAHVLLLNALSQCTAGDLKYAKMFAFLVCHAVSFLGRTEVNDQIDRQIKACKDKGVPISIHFEMVRKLVDQAPVEERITDMQVAYLAQVITQKYTPLVRPYSDLMSKLML